MVNLIVNQYHVEKPFSTISNFTKRIIKTCALKERSANYEGHMGIREYHGISSRGKAVCL
jgi:hypothetical protein